MSLVGLLGAEPDDVIHRLGRPAADRRVDGQRWIVWELEGLGTLRIRCDPAISTWVLTLTPPLPSTLQDAADRVGLWPQLAPEASEGERKTGLVRRELEAGDPERCSATARITGAGVDRLAVFDESPEW